MKTKQVTKEQLDAAEKARDAATRDYDKLNSLYIARVAEPHVFISVEEALFAFMELPDGSTAFEVAGPRLGQLPAPDFLKRLLPGKVGGA